MMIRTDEDIRRLREEGALTTAEETLIANCRTGLPTLLEDGKLPAGPSDARSVRADLLRYLITGACAEGPTQDDGVHLEGAFVAGRLDLDFATTKGRTALIACRFEIRIEALQARFALLNLNGSHLPGLFAQGAEVAGDVFLRRVKAEGEVSLAGAVIGGQLDSTDADFSNAGAKALHAEGTKVTESVVLSNVEAKGEVSLSGAVIGGQLACVGARFANSKGDALSAQGAKVAADVFLNKLDAEGEVRLSGAVIGGQLTCRGARFSNAGSKALNVQKIEVGQFFWREVERVTGSVDLNGARVSDLADDAASWKIVDKLYLNGFRYERIHGPMSAEVRLGWIAKDAKAAGEFRPQPYEQLARVYRAMGHDADWRRVLIEKETLQRADERQRLRAPLGFAGAVARFSKHTTQENAQAIQDIAESENGLDSGFARQLLDKYSLFHRNRPDEGDGTTASDHHSIAMAQAGFREEIFSNNASLRRQIAWNYAKDKTFRWLAGYGYQPFNVVWALVILLGIGWFMAYQAWHAGDFPPNSDVILSTPEWQGLAEDADVANPAEVWSDAANTGRDWETFQSLAYAFDIVVPIVTIGQTEAWAPSTTRGPWGWHLWWARWVLTVLGWIVTAVGAAAITGIIRRE